MDIEELMAHISISPDTLPLYHLIKRRLHSQPSLIIPSLDYAPLRLGSVFINSSGLTDATTLPGSGIFRM